MPDKNLFSRETIEKSPIVANNRMNRERNAEGVNSYEKDVFLSPKKFLSEKFSFQKELSWLDVCCGKGKALIQTAEYFAENSPDKSFRFTGIDLVNDFDEIHKNNPSIQFLERSFFDFETEQKFDLITCVHGLHYMGDKLGAIRKACSLLKDDGLFIANLDIHSFKNTADKNFHKKIAAWFSSNKMKYNSRKHLLEVEGRKIPEIPFQYLGADDTAGPNYTGQEAVDSYYSH